MRRPTCRARSATWKPTWPACGSCGRSPTTTGRSSAPTGCRALFATLHRELDDEYFEEISDHLKQLRFRAGALIDARLDRDNSGIDFVLRAPGDGRRRWAERLGIGPRSTYSFTIPPRDDAGGQILADLTGRGINLVANAAAQSADHIGSYFTMLRAELGFYVSCLNLGGPAGRQRSAASLSPTRRSRHRPTSRAPTFAMPAWSSSHRAR